MTERLTSAELRELIAIGEGVPEELARRVHAWYQSKTWRRVRVTVFVMRGGGVKLHAVSRDTSIRGRNGKTRVVLDTPMQVDEEPAEAERRARAQVGEGVPAALAKRVRDWTYKKRGTTLRVKLGMLGAGTARLRVFSGRRQLLVLDEQMGVDDDPRDIERRAKAMAALARP